MIPPKTRPRVGIFTRPIDQGTSGSGHHLREIVSHILSLNRDFEIFLIHYAPSRDSLYREAPELIVPRNPLAAARALAPYDFDIMHYSPLTMFSPIAGLKAKRVATIHGAEPNIIPGYYSLQARLHARFIKPPLARMMDRIFTVSETSKRYFAEHWGVRPERVSVAYNAVGQAYRSGLDSARVRAKYGIEGPYLFHISKYSGRKNPDCILRAFRLLAALPAHSDLKLVIAGSGWKNEAVIGALREWGLVERVVFTGFAPEDDAVLLFGGAEAFLFPSRAEGFGMPNVEAMACGCPVVTSRAFAIPEIVGDAALLLDDLDDHDELAAKVRRLLEDPVLRSAQIAKGFERVRRFDWNESARTVLAGYAELLR